MEQEGFNLEGKVWQAIKEYTINPNDKNAFTVEEWYKEYLKTEPLKNQKYELITKYHQAIMNHNKYRSDGI